MHGTTGNRPRQGQLKPRRAGCRRSDRAAAANAPRDGARAQGEAGAQCGHHESVLRCALPEMRPIQPGPHRSADVAAAAYLDTRQVFPLHARAHE